MTIHLGPKFRSVSRFISIPLSPAVPYGAFCDGNPPHTAFQVVLRAGPIVADRLLLRLGPRSVILYGRGRMLFAQKKKPPKSWTTSFLVTGRFSQVKVCNPFAITRKPPLRDGFFMHMMAERVGFEPTVRGLPVQRFSRPPPSTTRTPLHDMGQIPRRIAISYYKSNLHRSSRGKPRQTISRSLCGFRRAASGKNPSEAIRPLRPTPRKPLRPDG